MNESNLLKEAVIKYMKEKPQNEPFIFTKGKEYTRGEFLQEIEAGTDVGNGLIADIIYLTIDLLFRGKVSL